MNFVGCVSFIINMFNLKKELKIWKQAFKILSSKKFWKDFCKYCSSKEISKRIDNFAEKIK